MPDSNERTGSPEVAFGWLPDLPDHRDLPYGAMRLSLEAPLALPRKVDLRNVQFPIYDQDRLGSCTANAIGAALEYDRIRQGLPDFRPSRLFIYYLERAMEGTVNRDSGAFIRDGIKVVAQNGFPHEDTWPYDISKFAEQPPQSAFDDATKYLAVSYFRLDNTSINELKSCLAAGFPFVFGFTVYTSFFSANTNGGIVPMPGNEKVEGGHAVLAVGYDDDTERFAIRNSWSANRGDQGYYYMPYQYLNNAQLSADFWTIRTVTQATIAGAF
ncbi:MAG: C1 family peptidase [Geminicoccaceae bacterium]